jgi:hypothetical protein
MDVCGHLHAPALLPPAAVGFQSRSGRDGKENIAAPAGNTTPVIQPIDYSLYWLSNRGSNEMFIIGKSKHLRREAIENYFELLSRYLCRRTEKTTNNISKTVDF